MCREGLSRPGCRVYRDGTGGEGTRTCAHARATVGRTALYGDHFGSPGRDDRQDGTEPHGPWGDAGFPQYQPPSAEDVKVAGSPLPSQPEQPDLSGATSAMPIPGMAETAPVDDMEPTRHDLGAVPPGGPLPPNGPGPGDDDFESMRHKPRPSRNLIKIGAMAAAAAVVVGG